MSQRRRRGTPREYFTNLQVEMPLPRKLFYIARGIWLRAIRLQDCCGYPGMPGC